MIYVRGEARNKYGTGKYLLWRVNPRANAGGLITPRQFDRHFNFFLLFHTSISDQKRISVSDLRKGAAQRAGGIKNNNLRRTIIL